MVKSIVGFPNYGIDYKGNVTNTKMNRKVKSRENGKGYLHVYLCNNGKCANKYIHRLVAATFLGSLGKDDVVNHINGNKKDNSVTNLEVVSQKENIAHAERTKLIQRSKDGKFK